MSGTAPDFQAIARWFAARTGIAAVPRRLASAEIGIRRVMSCAGLDDPGRLLERLETDPILADALTDELTVAETYFFREPGQFAFVGREILPEIRGRLCDRHQIRAWSAGCATGEEAYSLAMVFLDQGLAERATVLGTDISCAALAKAAEGIYRPWSLRGEGATQAERHLSRRGELFEVSDAVRRLVAFLPVNLARDHFPSAATIVGRQDLIFCRNVLIYFDLETIAAVARRLYQSLAEGGWLITAPADPPLGGFAPFEVVTTDAGMVYRRPSGPREVGPSLQAGQLQAFPPWTSLESKVPADASLEAQTAVTVPGGREEADRGPEASAETDTEANEREAGDPLSPEECAARVRALANLDVGRAERACAEAAARHPLSSELHYLRAVLLLELDRDAEAEQSARRALYLDRGLALAHFTLGAILSRRGDQGGAWRSFRNARDLCAGMEPAQVVALSDGEPAGRLGRMAESQMLRLEASAEAGP